MFKLASKEFKQLLPLAIPAVLSQLAQMAMGVIDTLMAGHYSNDALAAIAIGTSLLHPVLVFFLGLFLAFNPVVSHFKGEENNKQIGSHFRLSILLAIIFSPIAILILFNADIVLTLLGVAPEISKIAIGYLHATTWGMPGLLIFLALRFCNEGMFSMRAVMISTVISIPFNIGLNYWFMYGGTFASITIEEQGAVGVGYATSLVWILMCIGLWTYTALAPKYKELNLFTSIKLPDFKHIIDVLKLGLPMAITLGFEITMFAAVSLMIARYPTEMMGAHQIAVNIASITFMLPLGLSQAITARVGYFSGKKDPKSKQIAGYTGIAFAAAISAFSSTVMVVIPYALVGLYTSDTTVIEIAVGLLLFAAIFQFSDAIQVASVGALRGMKDTKIPMIITAISYWLIGFPIGYILAEHYQYQANGYWIGLIAGLSAAAIMLLHRWIKLSKLKISQVQII